MFELNSLIPTSVAREVWQEWSSPDSMFKGVILLGLMQAICVFCDVGAANRRTAPGITHSSYARACIIPILVF